jgi:hypothetical protein
MCHVSCASNQSDPTSIVIYLNNIVEFSLVALTSPGTITAPESNVPGNGIWAIMVA